MECYVDDKHSVEDDVTTQVALAVGVEKYDGENKVI